MPLQASSGMNLDLLGERVQMLRTRVAGLRDAQGAAPPLPDPVVAVVAELDAAAEELHKLVAALRAPIPPEVPAESVESIARYRAISELTSDFIYELQVTPDNQLRLEWTSEAFTRTTGYTMDDLSPFNHGIDLVHPDDIALLTAAFLAVIEGHPREAEFRFRLRDGDYRWLRMHARPERDGPDQRVTRIVGAVRDITDYKRIGETLRFHARLLDLVEQPIIGADREGRITYWNRWAEKQFGWSSSQALGRLINEALPITAEQLLALQAHIASGQSFTSEWVGRRPDGVPFTMLTTITPLLADSGGIIGAVGLSVDITARKQAEDLLRNAYAELERRVRERTADLEAANVALRESQHMLQQIAETTTAIIYVYDLIEGRNVYVNRAITTILGYSLETIQAMDDAALRDLFHPDDRAGFDAYAQRCAAAADGEMLDYEYRLRAASGEWRWIYSRDSVFTRLPNGQTRQIIGLMFDITERKQAEELLIFQAHLLEIVQNAVVAVAPDGTILYWNPHAETLYGWPAHEVVGRNVLDIKMSIAPTHEAALRIADLGSGRAWSGEIEALRRDATTFPALVTGTPLRDASGKVTGIVGVLVDITEQKEAEERLRQAHADLERRVAERTAALADANMLLRWEIADRVRAEVQLRESEERYRKLIELHPDPISVNVDGIFIYVNPAAARLIGASGPEELIGQPIWRFLHPDDYTVMLDRRNLIVHIGQSVEPSEQRLVRLDGQIVYVEVISIPIIYRGRNAVLTVSRDMTARRRTEEQLRASLREQEVLLKEIHHRVKNNLQVISSLLDLQSDYITDAPIIAMFRESQNRIRAMALIHEKLYLSRNLAQIDFGEYLEDLTEHLFRSYATEVGAVRLVMEVDAILLGIDTAIPCGLILNELLANALKYAFPTGRPGEVQVRFRALPGNRLALTVSDNGVGLPDAFDLQQTVSLGLQLVQMLVRQLRGDLSLDRAQGTAFTVCFCASPPISKDNL